MEAYRESAKQNKATLEPQFDWGGISREQAVTLLAAPQNAVSFNMAALCNSSVTTGNS